MPEEKMTALQVKVDMIHDELRRFESDFRKDFAEHKQDDKHAFKEITDGMQKYETRIVKIETRIIFAISIASIIIGPLVSYLIKLLFD